MNNNISVYYQNAGGVNSKAKSSFPSSASCDYDLIIIVETWSDSLRSSSEFFDNRLNTVYRHN